MNSLKSLNYPEVITLLVATSLLQDPLICTTEEPQSLYICHDQFRAMSELKAIQNFTKLSNSGMQKMNDTFFQMDVEWYALLCCCFHVKDLHRL